MKVRGALAAAFLCAALEVATTAAQEPPPSLLKDMPEPAVVLADIRGPESLDLSARRVAAMDMLSDVVEVNSRKAPGGNWLVPEERALNGRYKQAASAIRNPLYNAFEPGDKRVPYDKSQRGMWNNRVDHYRQDVQFASQVLQHVPSQVRDAYLAALRRNIASSRATDPSARVTRMPGAVPPTSGVRAKVGPRNRPQWLITVVDTLIHTPAETLLIVGAAITIVLIFGCAFLLSLRV